MHYRRFAGSVRFALVCLPCTIGLPAVREAGPQCSLQQAPDFAARGAVCHIQFGDGGTIALGSIPMTAPTGRRTAGSVALEFAMIGPAFLGLLLFVLELGFLLYAQTALDYAVNQAARQMQTGQKTIANGAPQALFVSQNLCPFLGAFLTCTGVVVTLQPVTTFQTSISPAPLSTGTVNPGVRGSLQLLRAYYTPDIPVWPLNVNSLIGTAAYLNE
jgi:Flp pilus assembly protein TadG